MGVCIVGVGGEDHVVSISLSVTWVWCTSSYNIGFATFGIVMAVREGSAGAGSVAGHVMLW